MNYSNAVLLTGKVKLVGCHFGNTQKSYSFKTTEDLKVGDYALVQVAVGPNSPFGFSVVRVNKIGLVADYKSDIQYKWVISKIDLDSLNECLAQEEEFIAHLKTKASAKENEAHLSSFGMTVEDVAKLTPKFVNK